MDHPYIILAPSWNEKSAGVKALYQLCHDLRAYGQDAYMARTYSSANNPKLDNPFTDKYTPDAIVISPELFEGNVLNARKMVRYALNTVGFMGGPSDFPRTDMLYYFSKTFVHNNRDPENLLTPPLVDLDLFKDLNLPRFGACFVARKYKAHGGIVGNEAREWLELKDHDNTLKDIAKIFQTKNYFVCYENTYMMFEAVMAGCHVAPILNEHFKEVCKFEYVDFEHETAAVAAIKYAKQTEHYYKNQLPEFIYRTQRMAPQ